MNMKIEDEFRDMLISDASAEAYERNAVMLEKLERAIRKSDSQTTYLKSLLAGE